MEAEIEAGARALARALTPSTPPVTTRSRRVRRDVEDITKQDQDVQVMHGDQEITEDKVVPVGSQLDVAAGSKWKFRKGVGLVVYG